MKPPRFDQIDRAYKEAGYKIFYAPFDLNIFGVRSAEKQAGKFDDWIGVFYDNSAGGVNYHVWAATTDPSEYWLQKLGNPAGTFILMPGQWRGMWAKGLHRGQYPALVQRNTVKGWRDKNRDTILDMTPTTPVVQGIFGINGHRAHAVSEIQAVGPYSAGCQVTQNPRDFAVLMALVDKQIEEVKANVFTYTLFTEDQLPD